MSEFVCTPIKKVSRNKIKSRNGRDRLHGCFYAALALLVLVDLALGGVMAAPTQIPKPDFSSATPAIQEGYQEIRHKLENTLSSNSSDYEKSEAWGLLGMYLLQHEYLPEAMDAFRQAQQLVPQDARWPYYSGYIHALNGDNLAAVNAFQSSLKKNPYYAPAMVRLARIFLQTGDFERSESWFKKALRFGDTQAAALLGLGKIALQKGAAEEALSYFQQALALQPQANKLWFYQAQALAALGQQSEAQQALDKQGAFEVTFSDELISSMATLSRSASFYTNAATEALRAGNLRQAEDLALKAIRYAPENVHPYLTLAYVYSENGQPLKARKTMQEVLRLKPHSAQMLYAAGVLEEIAGADDQALALYKKALSAPEPFLHAWINKSRILMRHGHYNKALVALAQARKFKPENALLDYWSGAVNHHLGNCSPAVKDFYAAIDKEPENFAFLIGFVRAVADCSGSDKDRTNALNAARNLYRLAPVLPVIEALAAIEYRQGHYQEALDYQRQALFEAVKNKAPQWLFQRLQGNLRAMQARKRLQLKPQKEEEFLSPSPPNSVLQ